MSGIWQGAAGASYQRPDHYLLEEVPEELEGLCEDTGGEGAGRWKAPAWAVELLEQAGWSRYGYGGGRTSKRNAILKRLKAAREDPDQAAYEDSLWRLSEPEQPYWRGGMTGVYYVASGPNLPTFYPSPGVSSAPSGPPPPAKKKP